ncbi:hypothetical protein YTPLAS18_25940 [Nitrospira sp.]|nr:hypothetical protein YTPLAS18_25940 [Nitrospira sp.]
MAHPRAGPFGGSATAPEDEQVPWLALLPILATVAVYLLPHPIHHYTLVQFAPQLVAYFALTCWAQLNPHPLTRLGLEWPKLREGWRTGLWVGLLLGFVNVIVILSVVPSLGRDITFLQETPHAQIPRWIMLPWFIAVIAAFVEVNFRGFLLGRLLFLARGCSPLRAPELGGFLALLTSAILFAFDPFLVATFKHLHWIALWDGLVWGALWIRRRNLYIPIVAHAVEVAILYSVVRAWLP